MAFLERYLEIQKMRFEDRLQLTVDVPKELLADRVPSLILQPMLENAIEHGIAKRVGGGTIRIAASRANDLLTMSVYNDRPEIPVDWEQVRSGVGISNVRSRLRSLYGDEYQKSRKWRSRSIDGRPNRYAVQRPDGA
jgi:two-component system LytT family sensor kinase